MDIGKPKRIYKVEPLRDPVPRKREPAPGPRLVPPPEPARKPGRVGA